MEKPWRKYSELADIELNFLSMAAQNAVPGAILMAGIFRGGDVIEVKKAVPNRHVIIVDSFEGLAKPEVEDVQGCADPVGAGAFAATFVEVMKTLNEFDCLRNIEPYKRWITPNTLKTIDLSPLAMVWLDLDHYAPTLACMRHFWQWLQPGGIMLTHDYGFERTPGIKRAADAFGGEWKHMAGCIWGRINVREGATDEAVP